MATTARSTSTGGPGAVGATRGGSKRPARYERVDAGVALLRQTLVDLVRQGLARRGAGVLAELHRRLVDAQAPGLAAAIARIDSIDAGDAGDAGEGIDAHDDHAAERLVLGLGRLWLVCDAWRALERLPDGLQADVRATLGIPTTAAQVRTHADLSEDEWLVIGCAIEVDELRDLHTTRTWLRGKDSGRTALHLAFVGGMFAARRPRAATPRPGGMSAGSGAGGGDEGADVEQRLEPGTSFRGTLAFWPSAVPQRALVVDRGASDLLTTRRLPGRTGIREWLAEHAAMMARQPFLWRTLVVLGDVKVAPGPPGTDVALVGQVVDGDAALPFATPHALTLHALTGGHAADLVCEWDGRTLRPLSVIGRDGFAALESPDAPEASGG